MQARGERGNGETDFCLGLVAQWSVLHWYPSHRSWVQSQTRTSVFLILLFSFSLYFANILVTVYHHITCVSCSLQAPTIVRPSSLTGIADDVIDTMSLSSYLEEDEEETCSLSPTSSLAPSTSDVSVMCI